MQSPINLNQLLASLLTQTQSNQEPRRITRCGAPKEYHIPNSNFSFQVPQQVPQQGPRIEQRVEPSCPLKQLQHVLSQTPKPYSSSYADDEDTTVPMHNRLSPSDIASAQDTLISSSDMALLSLLQQLRKGNGDSGHGGFGGASGGGQNRSYGSGSYGGYGGQKHSAIDPSKLDPDSKEGVAYNFRNMRDPKQITHVPFQILAFVDPGCIHCKHYMPIFNRVKKHLETNRAEFRLPSKFQMIAVKAPLGMPVPNIVMYFDSQEIPVPPQVSRDEQFLTQAIKDIYGNYYRALKEQAQEEQMNRLRQQSEKRNGLESPYTQMLEEFDKWQKNNIQ